MTLKKYLCRYIYVFALCFTRVHGLRCNWRNREFMLQLSVLSSRLYITNKFYDSMIIFWRLAFILLYFNLVHGLQKSCKTVFISNFYFCQKYKHSISIFKIILYTYPFVILTFIKNTYDNIFYCLFINLGNFSVIRQCDTINFSLCSRI